MCSKRRAQEPFFLSIEQSETARVKRGGSVGASAVGSIDHLASNGLAAW